MRLDVGGVHVAFDWLAVVLFLGGGLIFFLRDPEGRPWRRPWRWAVVAAVGLAASFPVAVLPVAYTYGRGWLPSAACDPVFGTVRGVLDVGPEPLGDLYAEAYWKCYDVGYRHEHGEEEWLSSDLAYAAGDPTIPPQED